MSFFSNLPWSLFERIWSYSSRILSSRSFKRRAQIMFTCFNVNRCAEFELARASCCLDSWDEFVSSSLRSDVWLVADAAAVDEAGFNWWRRWSRRTSSFIRVSKASIEEWTISFCFIDVSCWVHQQNSNLSTRLVEHQEMLLSHCYRYP